MPKKEKVLITGGLGFIFSHVTEFFVSKGYDVVVIDNMTEGSNPEIIDGSFKFYKLGIEDVGIIKIIESENPDYIIHAAAISNVDFSIKFPLETLNSNIAANINIFEASRKLKNLKKLVYISTDEVYGECSYKKREDDIIFPKNPYSCSKAAGSLMRLSYDNTYEHLRDKTAETRFCNIFGPRQDSAKIISAIKKSIEEGYSIPVHESGSGYREYIYVKNIPKIVEHIMLHGNRVFNITLNDGYTVMDLIKKVQKITGKRVKYHFNDSRPGMDLTYQMNNDRFKKLDINMDYSFEDGIKEYLL